MNEAEKRNQRQLQQHLVRAVLAAQDSVAPELLDLISGDSPEAIDRSVEVAKAKTSQILQRARQEMVRPADQDFPGPSFDAHVREGISDQGVPDVSGMTWEQYSEYRKAAGIGQSSGGILDPIGR